MSSVARIGLLALVFASACRGISPCPTNATLHDGEYFVSSPLPRGISDIDGFGLGNAQLFLVIELEDGTKESLQFAVEKAKDVEEMWECQVYTETLYETDTHTELGADVQSEGGE